MNFRIESSRSHANCEQITGAVLRIQRSYGVKFQQQIQTIGDFYFLAGEHSGTDSRHNPRHLWPALAIFRTGKYGSPVRISKSGRQTCRDTDFR